MAAGIARIAFIAVRAADGVDGKWEAVVVGTNDQAGADWRYVCYPLDQLSTLLEDGNPFDEAESLSDIGRTARFHDGKRPEDPKIDPTPVVDDIYKPAPSAIELRHVVLCLAYRSSSVNEAGQGPAAKIFKEGPLARFDTVGFAERNGAAVTDRFVSRVVLQPKPGAASGRLKAFSAELRIRLSLNGLFFDEPSPDRQRPDRYDTGIVVMFRAEQPTASSALWTVKSGRAARCATIELWLSVRPFDPVAPATYNFSENIHPRPPAQGIDLTQCAVSTVVSPGGASARIFAIPFFAEAGIDQPPSPGPMDPGPPREFGFRVVKGTAAQPTRLALRVELEIGSYAQQTRAFFAELLPSVDDIPGVIPSSGVVSFAQEQRVDDIGKTDLVPRSEVSWVITAKVSPGGNTDQVTGHIAALLGKLVEQEHRALRTVRDGGPLSVLPSLQTQTTKGIPWHAVGILSDSRPRHRIMLDTTDPPRGAADPNRSTTLLSFEPRFIGNMWMGATPGSTYSSSSTAAFARLVDTNRRKPTFDAIISAPELVEVAGIEEPDCVHGPAWQAGVTGVWPGISAATVRFAIQLNKSKSASEVAIGALGFTLHQSPPADALEAGLITLSRYPADAPDMLPARIDAVMKFPVQSVAPVGQDDLIPRIREQLLGPAPERSADPFEPLLFELPDFGADTSGQKIRQLLVATEKLARGSDQSVSLSLQTQVVDRGAVPPRPMVLVLDPAPLRVAAVEYVEPAYAGTDESSQVAIWDAGGENGLSWRLRDDSETVRIVLPPQTIGEAMEKNAAGQADVASDIVPGRSAAARFSSPARLEIDPTYADTRFREPGWNLRRNLGYPNQRSPGSRLKDLRLELLYGMVARFQPREAGIDAFVTEIAGSIGAPQTPNPDAGIGEIRRHLELSGRLIRAQRYRLAVDKIWSGRVDAELKLEDGVSFRLRTIEQRGGKEYGPQTKLRWPTPGGIPADTGILIDRKILDDTFSSSSDDAVSFPGGVAWAFESPNILMKVYGRPEGDGGRLVGLHLSAHGGYGQQRALFDEKKTVVETETTQGRVHRYKLERIGRIGGLWNRAKHVIIYERTVVPSAQFFNRAPIGLLQDEHAGRPVLRKVEEYVEILQPLRRYPEDGTAVSAAGFLAGSEFKSRKIRVDSRWGGDVRREGWQVPLWNKAFNRLKPEGDNPDDPALIYPKPQIRLLLAGEGGSEIPAEISEPEKLVFYTSVVTGESGDNTDLWRPVRDIDFLDLPPPAAGKLKPRSEDLTDATLPAEPAHVPGFERMTIGLVRAREAAALAHGRAESGPSAIISNITIARAAPLAAAGPAGPAAFGRVLAQGGADLRAAFDAEAGRVLGTIEKLDSSLNEKPVADRVTAVVDSIVAGATASGFLTGFQQYAADLSGALGGIGKLDIKDDPCQSIGKRLKEVIGGQSARLRLVAEAAISDAATQLLSPLVSAGGIARSTIAQLADGLPSDQERAQLIEQLAELEVRALSVLEDARAEIKALEQRATTALGGFREEIGKGLKGVIGTSASTELSPLATAIGGIKDEIGKVLAAIDAARPLSEVKAAAAAARSLLDDRRKEISDVLQELDANPAERRVLVAIDHALATAVDATWQVEKLAQLPDPAVREAVRLADAELVGSADALLSRFGQGLDTTVGTLAGKLAEFVSEGASRALDLVDDVETFMEDGIGRDLLDAIDVAIIVLSDPDNLNPVYDPTAALHEALDGLTHAVDEVERALQKLVGDKTAGLTTAVDGFIAEVEQQADAVVVALMDSCRRIEGFFQDIFQDARQLADRLSKALDLEGYKQRLNDEIEGPLLELAKDGKATLDNLKQRASEEVAKITREAEGRARQIVGSAQETLRDALGTDPVKLADEANRIYQEGSQTLRLLRAVGDPPKTDRLGFNRPEVAYVLSEANKIVDMTPALALVNRVSDTIAAAEQAGKAVGDLMQSFGVRLPTAGLSEQVLSEKLKGLGVADLLPSMGGIDFRGLLRNFAFPDLDDSKAIKVRHGFDQAQMRAWLESELDVPFAEPAPLMSFGPVQIVVDDARFNARARLSAGRDGTQKSMNGRIFGDWRVVCSGMDILTFRQTGLFFDDTGKIDFRIDPERVELADALEFLTNFLAAAGKGDGLVIEPLMRGMIPAGVAATIDLQLPDIQAGVFGISNLSLHIMFGIAAIPEFELLGELSVSTKTSPFTLSIWILNGGGFLTQRLSFKPIAKPKPLLTYSLEVGIVAGVGLGFNFGVISGGVWLQVGCSITFTWSTGAGGSTTRITVFILARGNVDVAGLITAALMLLLEVSYDGNRMIGSGTVRFSIKISCFYTFKVSQHVEYVFAGEKKERADYADSYA